MTKSSTIPVYIGVDVSAETLDVYNMNTDIHQKINNSTSAIKKWIMTLDETSFITIESTGGYEKELRKLLDKHKLLCHVAHPNRVVNFIRCQGRKAKTDSLDAKMLALYGQKEQPTPTPLPTPIQEEFKALVARRRQITVALVQEKNRHNKTTHPAIKPLIKISIARLEEDKKQLEDMIKKFIKSHVELKEKAEILMSLKGVGPVTAAVMLAELSELGQASRNEIVALAGIAPFNNDSGKKQGRRKISGGRFNVRTALYMAATVAIRYNKVMIKYYAHLRENGKCFKVAIIAVARKMLITLNQMLKEGKKWKFTENYA